MEDNFGVFINTPGDGHCISWGVTEAVAEMAAKEFRAQYPNWADDTHVVCTNWDECERLHEMKYGKE
jgi:hypothetical protein